MQPKLIYENILETIGNTPLVKLSKLTGDLPVTLLGKLERANPGGSIKDRIALSLVEAAERSGQLKPGGTIVEASSGNMGIGLALVAAQKGYHCIIIMPWKMSAEREQIIRGLGGEVVRVPTEVAPDHPDSFLNTARRIAESTPNAFLINQFFNQENPATHYRTTGPEIWEQTEGKVDAFVMGMGTGGTISGVGRYLKEKNPAVRIVGAEPEGSILKTYFDEGEMPEGRIYMVEGIGEDFLPDALHLKWVDEMRWVSDQASFDMTLRLAREEGIFAGGSSGAQIQVALEVAAGLPPGSTIVTTLPDTGSLNAGKIVKITGRPFYTTQAETPTLEAMALMETHDLDLLPVLDNHTVQGTLYRDQLLSLLLHGENLDQTTVGNQMQPPLVVVEASTPLSELRKLLSDETSVLTKESDKPTGVIHRKEMFRFLKC
jgi:cystathionine beta-synthase